jgi:hypothetical protein
MKKLILLSIAFIGCNVQKTISFQSHVNTFNKDVDFYHKRTGLKFYSGQMVNDSQVFVIMKK